MVAQHYTFIKNNWLFTFSGWILWYINLHFNKTIKFLNEFRNYLSITEWQFATGFFWDLVTRDANRNGKRNNLFRDINTLRRVYRGNQRKLLRDESWECQKLVRKCSRLKGKAYKKRQTHTGSSSGDWNGGDLGNFKEHSSALMPKGAPEEQGPVETVDLPSPWRQGALLGSFKAQPRFFRDQNSQFPFIFFLGQKKECARRWLPFESENVAGRAKWGPVTLSRGEAAGTAKRNCPKRIFFRMTHAIFFLSLCDSDAHFTQTFACVFFPLPWLLASRLCTQCFPTPAPHSQSAW